MRLVRGMLLLAAVAGALPVCAKEEEADPPEVAIGERLFLGSRAPASSGTAHPSSAG